MENRSRKPGRRGNGEGTIYQRKNGIYAVTFTTASGKQKTLYAKTQKEAREKLRKTLYKVQQNIFIDTPLGCHKLQSLFARHVQAFYAQKIQEGDRKSVV